MDEPSEPRPQQIRHTRRVRVTSSRRGAARPPGGAALSRDLAEQTGLGEIYLQGLLRAQLRLSLTVLGVGVLALGGLPVLFLAVPATRELGVLGIPFPWLVLGGLVYPVAALAARWYARAAERLERDFAEIVGRG
jgi:hypothetical protein